MKIILTGATGFVGEGVLLACLQHPAVTEVLMVNRRPLTLAHPKLKELIVADFLQSRQFTAQLQGYDACFYCAGISSVGMNEKDYTHITYDTTLAFAETLSLLNNGLTFCFVSGSHTDSSEKGRIMWARVKGKTENALMRLPSLKTYNFRPGGMIPSAGQKNAKLVYRFMVRAIALFLPRLVSTLEEVGRAMINTAAKGYSKQIVEIPDIKSLARSNP